jgi:hypothetical protein
VAGLQPHDTRRIYRHPHTLSPAGTPGGVSQKSSRAQKAPPQTRWSDEDPSCLNSKIPQRAKNPHDGTPIGRESIG